jgi:hypothetical protein
MDEAYGARGSIVRLPPKLPVERFKRSVHYVCKIGAYVTSRQLLGHWERRTALPPMTFKWCDFLNRMRNSAPVTGLLGIKDHRVFGAMRLYNFISGVTETPCTSIDTAIADRVKPTSGFASDSATPCTTAYIK